MIKLDLPDRDFAGLIFDCDGTLADSMPLHYRAWSLAMERLGGQFPEDLFYLWGGTPTGVIVEQLNEKFGLTLDVEETVRIKEDAYLALIPEVEPIAEVMEIARQSRGRSRIAVASGGHRQLVEGTLGALGIIDWFDAVVCAEDYVRGKPAPDPFLEAARRIDVAPADCLVFEDTQLGIEAATAAGMASVLVPAFSRGRL